MGVFKRLTSNWRKPTKRNNQWPLASDIGFRLTTARTNRALARDRRRRKRARR